MNARLHNTIMRKVYYAYALGLVSDRMFGRGLFLGVLFGVFVHTVSIGNVISNLLTTGVQNAPSFFANALMGTELWTVVILGAILLVLAVSARDMLGFRLSHQRMIGA